MLILAFLVAALGTVMVAWVLTTMFARKQEARVPFVRVVEVNEISVDPQPWGLNWRINLTAGSRQPEISFTGERMPCRNPSSTSSLG